MEPVCPSNMKAQTSPSLGPTKDEGTLCLVSWSDIFVVMCPPPLTTPLRQHTCVA